jgi:Mysoin-binding motif of peroxisomes
LTSLTEYPQAAISLRVSTTENERFLDQFRYTVIASQLLVHEANTAVEARFSSPLGHTETLHYNADNSFSLQGAAASGAISFFTALTLHWAREQSSSHWLNVCIFLALALIVVIGIYGYARRKTSQRTRQAAMGALSDLITQSHAMDNVVRSALGLIQEVEIVSRGYEM